MAAEILVVGSLAYDSIQTPQGAVAKTLGGSANYFSLAAQFFAPVRVVGVVGEDYAESDQKLLSDRGVDLRGIQKVKGQTFHWAGRYSGDMNEAETLATELNVFADFKPELPQQFKRSPGVFLANIDPVLQLKVLEQIENPKMIAADTMNFWISSKRADLLKVVQKVGILIINEIEAEMLTGASNAIAAANELIKMGPEYVVIKRGEYGFVLRTQRDFFALPAFPIARVTDPTGAGDTFAGAFFGTLAERNFELTSGLVKLACLHGAVLASFTVEHFGVKGLVELTKAQIQHRLVEYRHSVTWDV